jgi:TonB family protein
MTNLKAFVILNALCVWMSGAPQTEPLGPGAFEKQALASVQGMPASELDAELPGLPFASWFSQIAGPRAGVVWQLTECGDQIVAPDNMDKTGRDLPACAEVNATLPDGRKVFVVISVGTFKKGMTGKPAFFGAAIEQNEQLYQVHKLRTLPEMLRAPSDAPGVQLAEKTQNRIVTPPLIKADSVRLNAPIHYLAPPAPIDPLVTAMTGGSSQVDEAPAAPPPSPQLPEKVSESILQSRAITRVKPAYPPSAKKMNATGTVEVQVTISEEGFVVEATAINGHFTLRSAAVEAARQWVFKPARLNGAPTRVKSVLTFVFTPGAK